MNKYNLGSNELSDYYASHNRIASYNLIHSSAASSRDRNPVVSSVTVC